MWNHRVIEHSYESGDKWYAIHEVFYDEDENPRQYTDPIAVVSEGDDPEGWEDSLRWTLEMMLECLSKKVLKEEEDFKVPPP